MGVGNMNGKTAVNMKGSTSTTKNMGWVSTLGRMDVDIMENGQIARGTGREKSYILMEARR